MPLYDLFCATCEKEEIDAFLHMDEVPGKCECGGQMRRKLCIPGFSPFKKGFYPELTGKDKIEFTSKKQLRAECEKRGKISDYLDG